MRTCKRCSCRLFRGEDLAGLCFDCYAKWLREYKSPEARAERARKWAEAVREAEELDIAGIVRRMKEN